MTYLKMPLQLQSAVAKKLQRCSYQESIAQHIMLLILSHHGEVIGREDFGSMIWDLEFNQETTECRCERHPFGNRRRKYR